MAQIPYSLIARITKAHGLNGEVMAVPAGDLTSFDDLFDTLAEGCQVYLVPPSTDIDSPVTVSGVKPMPKGLRMRLDGVDTIEAAQEIAGKMFLAATHDVTFTDSEQSHEEPEDVLGYAVFDEERGDMGTIEEILVTGANDVWVVHGRYGEVLIPVIDDVVIEVGEERIDVRLLDGLVDATVADSSEREAPQR